ncbi:hypothetical protein [Oleiharenicola lentus]|uniref:hypothetical protein n=1 Tax=Oleiharenicola lentus TaxID=2508720 RepID=UPI003F6622EA
MLTQNAVALPAILPRIRNVRRKISIGCLLFAWLCANGAVWNTVQVVAWAKMFHDYAQVMPLAQALKVTLEGNAMCDGCVFAQDAEDAAREQLPRDAALGGMDKFVFATELPAPIFSIEPEVSWPGVAHDVGLTRTESVPVPPPRV